jgi:serine/threonine protein phosphatase PrpC
VEAGTSDAYRLLSDGEMEVAETHPFLGGQVALFSARNPERETPNEDAAAVIPIDDARGILVVADGAGGLPSGRHASARAIEALRDAVRDADGAEMDTRYAILDGIEAANGAVQDLGVGAATTLVVVAIDHGFIRPYHVGDSMILVTGQRGRRKLETIAHSPTGYAVESGLMNEQEAIVHEERHLVSNLVGTKDMRIEVGARLELAPRDTVLLATDGLSDNLLTEEIVAHVRRGALGASATRLASACRQRAAGGDARAGKPDDITFIAFRPTRSRR